jgi:hypothetical protein
MMKKVLYIEPRNNDKEYHYYTLIGKSLTLQKDIHLIIGHSLGHYGVETLNNFDVIILGYGACANHNFTWNHSVLNTTTPVIAFLFKLSLYQEQKMKFLKNNNIIVFGQQNRIKLFEEKYKIQIHQTFYPFDSTVFRNMNLDKVYDVGMTGALHGAEHYRNDSFLPLEKNIRKRILLMLQETNLQTFLKCSDESYSKSKIVDTNDYVRTINKCKIWIATNADYGDLTPRFCEVIGCKTLLFCNEFPYSNQYLKDGETCVTFKNDLSDLLSKIEYYLSRPDDISRITNNAYTLFETNFSCHHIAKKYLKFAS